MNPIVFAMRTLVMMTMLTDALVRGGLYGLKKTWFAIFTWLNGLPLFAFVDDILKDLEQFTTFIVASDEFRLQYVDGRQACNARQLAKGQLSFLSGAAAEQAIAQGLTVVTERFRGGPMGLFHS